MVIESSEKNSIVIDGILEDLKDNPDFEIFCIKHEPVLSLSGLEIDLIHRHVFCDGQEINLTAKEYDLLCVLAANKGRVLTYDQIYRAVWKEEAFGNANNAIACHVHNLREKIGKVLQEGYFSIQCIREVGYCLEMDSKCAAST